MKNKNEGQTGRHEHPLKNEISDEQRQEVARAHQQADHDMEADVELTASHPNDDLDESETARLGEETGLI